MVFGLKFGPGKQVRDMTRFWSLDEILLDLGGIHC